MTTTTADARSALMGDVSADALRYDPWLHLAEQFPWVRVELGKLRPGRMGEWRNADVIVLAYYLAPNDARCTLAHELVHVERGPSPKDPVLAAAEETIVDEIAARRLITLTDLAGVLGMSNPYQMHAALHADLPTLQARLNTLSVLERTWLAEQTTITVAKLKTLQTKTGKLRAR